MSKLLMTLTLAALACAGARAQTATAAQHLIGEITAVDQAAGLVTVRTDAGQTVTVTTDERTVYRRLPPGETSLQKAERITRADLRAGDRVLVPGGTQPAQPAAQFIVTTRAPAAPTRDDARRRGVAGRVVALDAARKQIVIETRGGRDMARDASRAVTVDASGEGVRFMRYASDSFRRADARPGGFADIAVGDQLRALGERSEDGSRVKAEEVISGTIERIVGTVASVDAARGEVAVKSEQTGQTVVITVGKNSTLRRVPRETAEELASRAERRGGGGDARTDEERRERREQRRRERREERRSDDAAGAQTPATQPGDAQRQRPAGRSVQQIFESLPVIKVEDLKKGDTAVVTATTGADASRATAVSFIAGEASMLRWLQRFQRVADELREMSPGLPGNVLGGNTGSNDDGP